MGNIPCTGTPFPVVRNAVAFRGFTSQDRFIPLQTSVSPPSTFRLLVACVRPGAQADRAESVAALISESTDWDWLLELAAHHRVQGPLYRALASLPPACVPSDVQSHLESTARMAKVKNKFLVDEMERVQSLLAREGVRSIAFKGPVLANRVYQDGRYRLTHDIDLLVSPDTFDRAVERLVQDEYRPFRESNAHSLNRLGTYITQQTALVRGNSFAIDLHASLTPIVHASGAPFDTLWDRSVQQAVEGAHLQVLHPTDRLLMLCQQSIKNRWNRLKYTADFVECIWSLDNLDWEALWKEAHRTSQVRLLLVNLFVAHDLFRIAMPGFLHEEIKQDRHAGGIGTWAVNKLKGGKESVGISFSERTWLYWNIQDTVTHSVHYAAYSLLRNLWDRYESVRSAVRRSGK